MEPQPALPAAGHCPVCGGPLAEGRPVTCARCDAGHHRDCIEYGGGCAIFGCGSRAYRAPRGGLVRVLRPPPSDCPLDKKALVAVDGTLCTLERPVLRVEARNAERTRRAARRAGVAATGVTLGLLAVPAWPVIRVVVLGILSIFKVHGGVLILMFLFVLPALLALVWTTAVVFVRGVSYALACLVYRLDGGEFVLDREAHRLIHRRRVMGLPAGAESWSADDLASIALTTPGTGETVTLEARLLRGRSVVLADDNRVYMDGYHWTDLARIGRRMAADAGVPFEWSLPWKAEPVGAIEEKNC